MFKRMQSMQMQAVHCFQTNSPSQQQFRAIIAIHNTQLGPALGGCRCLQYSHEQLAFDDAMRLAQGMSYKAALANLEQGGGKSVILLPNDVPLENIDREFLFDWFGQCVEQLNGLYITAMDVGSQVSDMDFVAKKTAHVASASNIGDPAESTAKGVLVGIKTSLAFEFGDDKITGKRFAVQGLGHVGWRVAKSLLALGGDVVVADINPDMCQQAESLGMKVVSVSDILTQPCDVLVPCALGGIIDEESVKALQCKIIAGSANNQLIDDSIAEILNQRNILYAPDYIINSGGLIFAALHYYHKNSADLNRIIDEKIVGIHFTLLEVFQQAKQSSLNINQVANALAETRLSQGLKKDVGGVYDAA